jgi:hypothetical protein
MRKSALISSLAVIAALSVAVVRTGDAAPKPDLSRALDRTTHVASKRYVLRVRIAKGDEPLSLRVRGQSNHETISVRLRMGDVTLPDGTKAPGPSTAALLLGPFLYERAPSNIAVLGKLRWLRLHVADLSDAAPELKAVHALTPEPLLRLLAEARLTQATPEGRLFRGAVAYDNPVVRASLARLTGGIEFRGLRLSVYVGLDGLVHRLLLTGRTADHQTTLSLSARLFGFGRPVHVTPPKPGTFLDEHLAKLAA